jgi:hypothetical protein
MQRLEVSGAVRPLKWPLGVKWLITQNLAMITKDTAVFLGGFFVVYDK